MVSRSFARSPRFVRLLVLLVCVIAAPRVSAAQATGSIAGTVVDPLGARVAGATVTVLRDARALRATQTDEAGQFVFSDLPADRYEIEATAAGFQIRRTAPVFLAAGAALRIEVSLPIGPLETAVTVSASATEVLPSQIGAAVTVLDAKTLDAIGKPDLLEALRLVPGSSLVQTGGRGGTTSLFIRGGNSNFNKLLLDGIPANDIGGGIELSSLSLAGVERVEVLRESNSVIAGTDALAGLVSVITKRGSTRVPQAALSLDGGSLATHRETASLGGLVQRVDYFSELARFATDNDLANNRNRLTTYAGRFGAAVGSNAELSGTVRWLDKYYESPNAIRLYGTPDDASQTNSLRVIGVGGQTQISAKWQASARVGLSDQRARYVNPTVSGENLFGVGYGQPVTIVGANGYSATGRGVLDYGTYDSKTRSARQGLYAQTSYRFNAALSVAGGGDYEREQAFTDPDADPTTTRHNRALWIEGRGAVADRATVAVGLGHAHIDQYASRYSPRLSVGVYLRKPTAAALWNDTKVTFNAGKGIKGTGITTVASSLYNLLQKTPAGAALATSAGIEPIGPERGRNVDVGIEQGLWKGHARVRAAYFDNAFYDLVEFVGRNLLPQFGVSPAVAAAAGSGAYVNSQSFAAKGLELSVDAVFGRVRAAGSYTYLDATVTKSLSSSVTPQFNPLFPGIPIGGFTALVGQRPFRRPANSGSALVAWSHDRLDVAMSGYFAGAADDSTFIVGSDINFGNTLLLPNRNLNSGYQKIDVSGNYRIHPRVTWFATVENLLNRDYQPTFGFPALPINIRTGATVVVGGRR